MRWFRFSGVIQTSLSSDVGKNTDDLLDKYLHAWPWFTWRLVYFAESCHGFRMTCGMYCKTLLRLNIPLVWKFVIFGKSLWESYMLIQNTDVIVTERGNESWQKLSCILHELALSGVFKFLWFVSFLFYVLEPFTLLGEKRNANLWFCVWLLLFWRKGVRVMTAHSLSPLGMQ